MATNFDFNPFTENIANELSENSNKRILANVGKISLRQRKPRIIRDKFIIDKSLKIRLKKLFTSSTNENVKRIAQDILSLKYVPESGYNYLGLSNSDYSKISYLDSSRSSKFKNYIKPEIILDKDCFYYYNKNRKKLIKVKTEFKDIFSINSLNLYYDELVVSIFGWENTRTILESKEIPSEFSNPNYFYNSNGLNEDQIKELQQTIGTYTSITDVEYYENLFNNYLNNYVTEHLEKLNKFLYQELNTFPEYSSNLNNTIFNLNNEIYLNLGSTIQISKINNNYVYDISAAERTFNLSRYLGSFRVDSDKVITSSLVFVKPKLVFKEKIWDSTLRYHTTIGKLVRKILPNKYNDVEITDFSEEYSKLIIVNNNYEYLEVSGEDIRESYYENNAINEGPLGSSCMRYSRCQDYLDIYVKNPNVKLAILKYRGKIACRSLLWTIENKIYNDRIYYYNNDSKYTIENILAEKGYESIFNRGKNLSLPIDMATFEYYEEYPYMDTFRFYHIEEQKLCTEAHKNNKHYILTNTDGSYTDETESIYECDHCGDEYDRNDLESVGASYNNGYLLCSECRIYSEYHNYYIHPNDTNHYFGCIISINSSGNAYFDAVRDTDCVETINGQQAIFENVTKLENDYGYIVLDYNEHTEYYEEFNGNFYHIDDPALEEIIEELNKQLNEQSN
jgi:hypothetical protein